MYAIVRWLGIFVAIYISFWIAGARESKDGFRYFVTAFIVWAVLWALMYLLSLAWSRWRKAN